LEMESFGSVQEHVHAVAHTEGVHVVRAHAAELPPRYLRHPGAAEPDRHMGDAVAVDSWTGARGVIPRSEGLRDLEELEDVHRAGSKLIQQLEHVVAARADRAAQWRVRPVRVLQRRPELVQALPLGLVIDLAANALEQLDGAELRAVLAHEGHHVARRDPLRLFVAHVLSEALFFLPVMRRLRRHYSALTELAADEAAVHANGETQPLASAMLTFGELDSTLVVGVSEERIDHLCGEPARWELPAWLLLGAVLTLAALGALVLTAARATQPSQINASLLLMQSCGPAMLLLAGLLAARAVRFARSR